VTVGILISTYRCCGAEAITAGRFSPRVTDYCIVQALLCRRNTVEVESRKRYAGVLVGFVTSIDANKAKYSPVTASRT
jgi:hypothetical protein